MKAFINDYQEWAPLPQSSCEYDPELRMLTDSFLQSHPVRPV